MKENKIFWKCNYKNDAKDLIKVLSDKHLIIELRERKGERSKFIKNYSDGNMYTDTKSIEEQCKFIDSLKLNMYSFIVIKSII